MGIVSVLLALCEGNPGTDDHRIPLARSQWCTALMFSLLLVRRNGATNSRVADDLRRHATHVSVVMEYSLSTFRAIRYGHFSAFGNIHDKPGFQRYLRVQSVQRTYGFTLMKHDIDSNNLTYLFTKINILTEKLTKKIVTPTSDGKLKSKSIHKAGAIDKKSHYFYNSFVLKRKWRYFDELYVTVCCDDSFVKILSKRRTIPFHICFRVSFVPSSFFRIQLGYPRYQFHFLYL